MTSRSDYSIIEGCIRQSSGLPIHDPLPCVEYDLALAKLYDEGWPNIPHYHEGARQETS